MEIKVSSEPVYMSDVNKAQSMYAVVADKLKNEEVTLDFGNIEGATSSWLFALIGNLVISHKDLFFNKVKLIHLSPTLKDQVDFTVRMAVQKLEEKRSKAS